jgi:hypothetical protein
MLRAGAASVPTQGNPAVWGTQPSDELLTHEVRIQTSSADFFPRLLRLFENCGEEAVAGMNSRNRAQKRPARE